MPRNTDLAKIHIAKKQLAMEDDTYRDMLWTVARVRSSGDLDTEGRKVVLEHLYKLGFKAKASSKPKPKNLDTKLQLSKVEALLADMKLEWAYADSIAKRMYKVEKAQWLTEGKQLRALIAALVREQQKRKKLEAKDD